MRKGNRSERRAARAASQPAVATLPTQPVETKAVPSVAPATRIQSNAMLHWVLASRFSTAFLAHKEVVKHRVNSASGVSAVTEIVNKALIKAHTPQPALTSVVEHAPLLSYGQLEEAKSQPIPDSTISAPAAAAVAPPAKENTLFYSGDGYCIPTEKFKGNMDNDRIINEFDEQFIAATAEGFTDLTIQFPHYEGDVFNPNNSGGPSVRKILDAWCPGVGGFNQVIKGFNGYRVIFEEDFLVELIQTVLIRQNPPTEEMEILQATNMAELSTLAKKYTAALASVSTQVAADAKAAPPPLPAAGAAAVAARVGRPSAFTFVIKPTGP